MSALAKALRRLPPEHRVALEWFQDRRGEIVSIPKRFNGVALLNAQTGIQKPKGWQHALSVKQTLKQKYANVLERRADGSWVFTYAKQKVDAHDSQRSTNNSVARAAADERPVAVVIQTRAKGPALYEILGLGRVISWSGEAFVFEGYDDAGEMATPPTPQPTESIFEPISVQDWRKRVLTEIAVREGSKAFKNNAVNAFEGRCLITGARDSLVLQAAHIVPYLGEHTDRRDNAILLRADLHILFDREAIWIDPDTLTIRVKNSLGDKVYRELDGRPVVLPKEIDASIFAKRLAERDAFLEGKKSKKS